MPQTTTQAPAPVVRRAVKPAGTTEIVPNPDGSLPRSVRANEYRDSYPVSRPPVTKSPQPRQIPTVNPLTSLSSQGTMAAPKPPVLPKPVAPLQLSKPVTPVQVPKPKALASVSQALAVTKPAAAALPSKLNTVEPPTQLPPGPFNRNVIVIDPSHGGTDIGSRVTDSVFEKDVDLQFAFKLRSLLTARGFNVVLTRESDTATLPDKPDSPLTLDARAGLANRQQPVACLLLHATGSGHGAHLYTSELTSVSAEPYAAPWLTAQNGWVAQSLLLQKQIGRALTRASIPLVLSRASVRPVDSLTCPALVIELAPESNSDAGSINSDAYQQRVANAVATALLFWQNSAQPPARLAPPVYKAPAPVVKSAIDATTPLTPVTPAVQP